jgi:hypothetical protein
MSVDKPFIGEIEIDIFEGVETDWIKIKLLECLLKKLKMVQVRESVFQWETKTRTVYDINKNMMKCFVSQD